MEIKNVVIMSEKQFFQINHFKLIKDLFKNITNLRVNHDFYQNSNA